MDLEKFLSENKEEHYNFVVPTTYKISTGSLWLDSIMEGGFSPGIHRLGGASEGGKSAMSLLVAKNFLEAVPNARVVLVKAEGRLSKNAIKRSGLEFTNDAVEWKEDGSKVFVFKCNIYDVVAQMIYSMITDNPEEHRYMFIIDSMDGLILRNDSQKSFDGGESVKIAGPQVLTKLLFKRTSLPVCEYGHMVFTLAQVIAKIEPKYEVKEQLVVGGSGGNAAVHFSNFIIRFLPRYKKDFITVDGKAADTDSVSTNIVGHWCNVEIQKSDNETTGLKISYPIKHEETGTNCIWSELEFTDILQLKGFLTVNGKSNKFSPNFVDLLKLELGDDVPESFGSAAKRNDYFQIPEVSKAIRDILIRVMSEKEIVL